ncbi:sucrase ferredoxin [Synechococcus sp. PCC 7336]|uniref:sucrase ferredoxin n=1 Tax=Synechococcus sp. PCC 7336 TaxID=195250 RepID=UPI000349B009|nr:sucrase ferredoxin [Synechococcus sp. PCC 7336]
MRSDSLSTRDCRYCSAVSQASGETPIGTAGSLDHWIAIALPQPRPRQLWAARPLLAPLEQLPKAIAIRRGQRLRLVAISSDRNDYNPDRVRVLHYYRPEGPFAEFNRSEYLLPETEVVSLVRSILSNPQARSPFQHYCQKAGKGMRDLFVCTHTRHDLACGRYGTPLFRLLYRKYNHLDRLRVWQSSHFGGHRFAPTLMDFPSGHCWGHLNSDRLEEVLETLVERQGECQILKPFYRGWAGTHKFGQLLESELWMQTGWDWLSYRRSARVVQPNLSGLRAFLWQALRIVPGRRALNGRDALAMAARQAEVRLDYNRPDGKAESCRARIEVCGQVATMARSDTDERVVLPQYRVSILSDTEPLAGSDSRDRA